MNGLKKTQDGVNKSVTEAQIQNLLKAPHGQGASCHTAWMPGLIGAKWLYTNKAKSSHFCTEFWELASLDMNAFVKRDYLYKVWENTKGQEKAAENHLSLFKISARPYHPTCFNCVTLIAGEEATDCYTQTKLIMHHCEHSMHTRIWRFLEYLLLIYTHRPVKRWQREYQALPIAAAAVAARNYFLAHIRI